MLQRFEANSPPARAATRALSICLISEEYPPDSGWGGIGTYSYNLARGLAAQGHRVHVIARGWGEDQTELVDGVNVHRLALAEPSWRRGTWFINMRFPETRGVVLWNRRANQFLRKIRDREQIDVIESPEYHAQGLAASFGHDDLPCVVRLHTPAYLCRQLNGSAVGGSAADTWLNEQMECMLARRVSTITSPSRHMADQVAGFWRLSSQRVAVIPNPIDHDLFACDDSRQRDPFTMLFVGRLERRKGVEAIARALPIIRQAFPAARVRLVGQDHPSGPGGTSMKEHLLVQLRENETPADAIEFAGPLPRAQLPAEYAKSSICLLPSLYESFGYTCVEAMASGCAVVTSRAGALPEIVTDGVDGLLVEPDDAESLAAAAIRLLADSELRARLGDAARQTVAARFAQPAVCTAMANLYRAVLR